jgi:glycosyltransferase involved in cell wall biosynthesis
MRIVMVNKYARMSGGADRQCLALAQALRGAGHEVLFLATASEDNLEVRGEFVPTVVTHESRDRLSARQRALVARNAIWNRGAATALQRLLASFRPDVVHVHLLYPHLSVSPVAVARRSHVPVVQTLHDYQFLSANPFDSSGSPFDRLEARRSYRALNTATFVVRRTIHRRAVTRWIAVSEHVARAHERRGIRATVIPNFTDLEPDGDSPSFDTRDGILFLGALAQEKGVFDVLRLAGELPDVRVSVAGRGPLTSTVVREASARANLEFKGFLSAAAGRDAIREARVLVVPSHWEEPAGLVTLEAMACGTPIIAYDRGGLSEYVAAPGSGVTVDADWRLLATACRALLVDRASWERHSRAGLVATRTTFSKDAHVDAVQRVYREAIEAG